MTAAEPTPVVDLDAIRADQRACTAMGPFRGEPDAIDRLVDVHVPALLALVEQQAAENAANEKATNADGRIIADLEAINGDLIDENARLTAERDRLRTAWRSARLRAEETRDHRAERLDAVAVARGMVAENFALKRALGWMRTTDRLPPAEMPLYPGRVEWIVQVREPDEPFAEPDGWARIWPRGDAWEDAHARAARHRERSPEVPVRVVAVESTYRLDASRAPESPAITPRPSGGTDSAPDRS